MCANVAIASWPDCAQNILISRVRFPTSRAQCRHGKKNNTAAAVISLYKFHQIVNILHAVPVADDRNFLFTQCGPII